MKKLSVFALALLLFSLTSIVCAREAKLVRYPSYSNGRIAFTYLGDIWTADENGQNVQRLTVNKARDAYPRFSPDGKWIAFSSDRNGNLDVFIIPSTGGTAKQLTHHSADDVVLGWTPDGTGVLFSSQRGEDFMALLYVVSVNGGMPWRAGPDMGNAASFSPDGKRIAYNPKGQVYWRKYYRGAYATDVWIEDVSTKKFSQLTDFDGLDSWPMWGKDGIYFVSDRDGGGLTNIWRIGENGGKADKVTSFKTGDVRFPSISSDGRVIVFEHDFGIWKLDTGSKKVTPIKLDIEAETEENDNETLSFASVAEDYDLAPNARRIVISTHGELFTVPVEEGDIRQITDSPARDVNVEYSPDGKSIAFISDRSGREELYVTAADGTGEAQKLTDIDALKLGYRWSPDSKEIAFTASDDKLRKVNVGSKQIVELDSTRYGNISAPEWSPDGKWLAYSKADESRTTDVYVLASSGQEKEAHKVTFDSYDERAPRFSPDGRKLFFVRSESTGGGGGGGGFGNASIQLYSVGLEKLDRDPDDPEERAEAEAPQPAPGGGDAEGGPPRRATGPRPPHETKMDWAGMKHRTRQITRMPFAVGNYTVAPDSRTIIFVTSEPSTTGSTPVIYSIQDDGRRLTRVTSGGPPQGEGEGGPGGGGGFGGGLGDLNISRDGRTLFFREREAIYSVALPGGGAAAAATAGRGPAGAGGGAEAARRRINFNVRVKVNRPAEWAEMFGDAWRTMKYRFYDPAMHGMDWDAAKAKYEPLVKDVGDRQELLNIINEMIGELNASHTGAAPPPGGRAAGGVSTGNLGIELEPDAAAGRYKVTYIYEGGPADKDWVKVNVGDYLIAIGDKQVKAGDEYWELLNDRLNRKVEVTFNNKPAAEGAWKTRIETVNGQAYATLRYDRWVKERRQKVDELSNGRVGYIHIRAMDQPSLRKFEKEIREFRNKDAMIIDQRWNGGGNIEQELLAILVQREYEVWRPRGVEASGRPFAGYFGPKVVLQNWRSASNAEMFPAGFRALGLGKVVGTPTMGAVIGTGSYSLIDASTVRTPGVGVYLADAKHTNMENYGVQPDIRVDNTPEDNLAGRDRQLEAAVDELLKQLGGQKRNIASKDDQ
jgi:tricorn protease